MLRTFSSTDRRYRAAPDDNGRAAADRHDLLGLPVPGVAALLTSGLKDLETADRCGAADDKLQRSGRRGGPS